MDTPSVAQQLRAISVLPMRMRVAASGNPFPLLGKHMPSAPRPE